jgi:Sec-independent protein secretion pathway component TatC
MIFLQVLGALIVFFIVIPLIMCIVDNDYDYHHHK